MKPDNVDVVVKPSLSSLPLQVALFYNALFSVMFGMLMGAATIDKLSKYNQSLGLAVICIWAAVEPVRLYYGFAGNLKESVAHLSTFLLMTVFPQMPLVVFLAYFQALRYPIDSIMGSFLFIFLVFEMAFGWLLTRRVITNQTAQFMRLVDHDD